MIAPVTVLNEFGLQAEKWQFFGTFAKRPDITLEGSMTSARAEYLAYEKSLEWVRDRVIHDYEAAHARIMAMYGTP